MSADFSEWIGRTQSAPDDVITQRLTTQFNATLGDHLFPDLEAPLGLHWCLCPTAIPTDALASDGHPAKGDFLPPVSLSRRMWAGGEIEYLAPLHAGDPIQKTSRIESVAQK